MRRVARASVRSPATRRTDTCHDSRRSARAVEGTAVDARRYTTQHATAARGARRGVRSTIGYDLHLVDTPCTSHRLTSTAGAAGVSGPARATTHVTPYESTTVDAQLNVFKAPTAAHVIQICRLAYSLLRSTYYGAAGTLG